MVMEIGNGQMVMPPEAALGVLPPPRTEGPKVPGLKLVVIVESDTKIPVENFNALFLSNLESAGFKVVGKPKVVVEDSPIWVWRRYEWGERPDVTNYHPEAQKGPTWIATVATGPFKGYEGEYAAPTTCVYVKDKLKSCKTSAPTAQDTADLPKVVEAWEVVLRPVEKGDIESKKAVAGKAILQPLDQLEKGLRAYPKVGMAVVDVEAPPGRGGAGLGMLALAVGIGLALMTWQRKS